MPTGSMTPHVHISALEGFKVCLYVLIGFGAAHVIARRYEGHPLADTFLDIWC